MSFQIHALPAEPFAALFDLGDPELASHRARRMVADCRPGFPCRVSLADAEPGEEVLLLNFEHLAGSSPFRAFHAIYVRRNASQMRPARGEVPEALGQRLLSIRAFDAADMMVAADVVDGADLGKGLGSMLRLPGVAGVHIHYARQGCYAARATAA